MTEQLVLELARKSMVVTLELALPLLLLALVVGVLISIFQALTQIQEMTLTFVPKILAVATAVIVAGPWMLQRLVHFTRDLWSSMPNVVR